ncbi:transcriptional regulator domain-containing protein [Mesorhizobium sp. P5_C1]
MRPDTSHWRDNASYDYFDTLPVEGLAWECLRRHEPYQRHYQALLTTRAEKAPFHLETQRLWGLRFPGQAGFVRLGARRSVVA